jgi:hypothetical protein
MDKNSSDMEDEIFDIVTDLIRDDITKDEAIEQLLILSNVSNRRELLLDFCIKKLRYKGVMMLENPYQVVDEYLKSNNSC